MALSQREQQILEQIAVELCVNDPRLARKLAKTTSAAKVQRRQRMGAAAAFAVGLTMLTGAILIPSYVTGGVFVVSVSGYLAMFAAGVRWVTVSHGRMTGSERRNRGQHVGGTG